MVWFAGLDPNEKKKEINICLTWFVSILIPVRSSALTEGSGASALFDDWRPLLDHVFPNITSVPNHSMVHSHAVPNNDNEF